MKTIQVEAGKLNNNEILRASGVKKIHSGWYTVQYNGVVLDNSTVVRARRNIRGQLRISGFSKNWRGQTVQF